MTSFRSRTLTLRGKVLAEGDLDQVFPLFSPPGESLWVPGWDPEYLYPASEDWSEGQIFRTREESGEAVWVVSRLDRKNHYARYHRVEPGHYVACVQVQCRPASGKTEVEISYSFVGLSPGGNDAIAAMSEAEYREKMARWSRWVNDYLAGTP